MDTQNPEADDAPTTPMATSELMGVVGDVASAYLANPSNRVDIGQIPQVIDNIARSLRTVHWPVHSTTEIPDAPIPDGLIPAVPVKRSVLRYAIVCLECGERFQTMKRHLATVHHLEPNAYREKWGLPPNYPLVAPNHTEHRSQLAKKMGLGARAIDDPSPPPPATKRTKPAPAKPAPAKPAPGGKAARDA